MANLDRDAHARSVQGMFTRIASRYDLINRLMTAGQDQRWRREVIRRAGLPAGGRLLDLGAGTGDLAREALRQVPSAQVTAADFTLAMMLAGKPRSPQPDWSAADALRLPFPEAAFDSVVSGFLLRNVSDLRAALAEQRRVLKPGGCLVALDTTPPGRSLLTPFINLHLHTIIPALGRWLTGDRQAYTYLPNSTEHFLRAEVLAARLSEAGFHQVGFRRLMFGTIAIHWGRKD